MFFFDEAHLLFNDAPKALLEKIEQVVRLIRSKGVGVYFVTQNPLDVPDTVLGQLGNRVQHALRAFTPRDQKAVKTAAETLRPNPKLDTEQAITELGVGEALVSLLDEKGTPERGRARLHRAARRARSARSATTSAQSSIAVARTFSATTRRRSTASRPTRSSRAAPRRSPRSPSESANPVHDPVHDILFGRTGPRGGRQSQGIIEAVTKSAARSIGSELGRQVLRGVLGSILGGKKR